MTSEFGVDLTHLKVALDHIQSQVQVPLMERRAKRRKTDPAVELLEVIQELTERESELNAAVGIAKMLMDKMKVAQETVQYLSEEIVISENRANEFESDFYALRKEHEVLGKENTAASQANEALELLVAELTTENADLVKQVASFQVETKSNSQAHQERLAQELEAVVGEKAALKADLESKA
jgi:chromosome segregation ATPase